MIKWITIDVNKSSPWVMVNVKKEEEKDTIRKLNELLSKIG